MRIRKPLEPVYLLNKDRYRVQKFYDELDVGRLEGSAQVRLSLQRKTFQTQDIPKFCHLRWGCVDAPKGRTHFLPDGRLNGRIPEIWHVGGYSLPIREFALETTHSKKSRSDISKFFIQEWIEPEEPELPAKPVDAKTLVESYLTTCTQMVLNADGTTTREVVPHSYAAFEFRQFFIKFHGKLDQLPDLQLKGNLFTSSLTAPLYEAARRYVSVVPTEYGPTYASSDSKTWYVRLPRIFFNNENLRAELNSFLDDYRARILGSGPHGEALLSATTLNLTWGSTVQPPPERPDPILLRYDNPALFDEIELAMKRLATVRVDYIPDIDAYEDSREALLKACTAHFSSELLPGWLVPSGSNVQLDNRQETASSGVWHKIVNCASIFTGTYKPKGSPLNPFISVYPRRLSKNTDAGTIADRLSAMDWNMLLAIKDLPEITKALMVLCHIAVLSGRQKLQSVGDVVHLFSDQWLNFNFGVSPSVSDAHSAIDTLLHALHVVDVPARVSSILHIEGPRSALPPEIAVFTSEEEVSESVDSDYEPSSYTHILQEWLFDADVVRHNVTFALVPRTIVRYKGYYPLPELKERLSDTDRNLLIAKLAGLGKDATIRAVGELLWDILPWSFLFDYFVSVSDYVTTYGAADKNNLIHLAELSDYRFQGYELLATHWFSASRDDRGIKKPLGVTHGPTFVVARYGLREFRRFAGLSGLPRNALNLSTPSTHQMLNIAALMGVRISK
jgi:hypothetical protein